MRRHLPLLALIAALLLGVVVWKTSMRRDALVVYCAHDSIYAEKILRDFEKRTGIPVAVRFDTEATKSLGLVELLVAEKDAPRCDVFWNNELLGTLDLAGRGVLEPFLGENHERIPPAFRAEDGRWIGFAARLRVCIFNTQKIPPAIAATEIPARLRSLDARFAMAKPLYGTTLTHYAALWDAWGADRLQAWHRETRRAGLRELSGNAAVKDAVAAGVCDLGFTDTDDFFAAKDAGQPVAMQPVRLDDGATICIPNTVAIIRGTKRAQAAGRLVEFLTSAETELALARSGSRQIPLGPVPSEALPPEVRELTGWAGEGRDLRRLGPARTACLAWLKADALR